LRRLRIPIAGLMLAILPLAIGLAALRNPSELWASALFSLAVLALLASALGTVARRGASRMAFLGFTLFGGCYLTWAFGPWVWFNRDGLRPPPLVTGMLLDRIQETQVGPTADWKGISYGILLSSTRLQQTVRWADLANAPAPTGSLSVGSMYVPYDVSPYKQIAHSMLALLAGALGIFISRIVAPREDSSRQPRVTGEP
jgi:hypothetical protein